MWWVPPEASLSPRHSTSVVPIPVLPWELSHAVAPTVGVRCWGIHNPTPNPRPRALGVAGWFPFSVSLTYSPTGISRGHPHPINYMLRCTNLCMGLDFRGTPSKAVMRVPMGLSRHRGRKKGNQGFPGCRSELHEPEACSVPGTVCKASQVVFHPRSSSAPPLTELTTEAPGGEVICSRPHRH